MKNTLLTAEIEKIKDILINRVSPYLIVIFGSAAKKRLRKDSDVDIAFLSDKYFDDYEIFMISQELADVLNRDVDLIDLNKATTVLKAQIIGNGKIIYSKNDRKVSEYRIRALKEYCLLNEERQVILQKIKERGYIYE
ncbi:type VII toxin-antitoxin system MntA family adenylyltransferase antitoxin [Caloranaerobacter azorensis]|uniref:Nucleotidyltransferase domain-containing protein n=1 Tax=Caloranaerobacter azorensis TaxID=116090 RepID=A0A6P1YE05_9FIRM|nr:nucleotidyltransferase domain-containing protein [Caloranaerobacter azorensis]QIB26993.1 nucleotidyltransferase domain-containing protein [Caloranaerobacter azorensis]